MFSLLNVSFQNSSPLRLVETDNLQDVSCVDPAIGPPPHYGDSLDDTFVDGDATVGGLEDDAFFFGGHGGCMGGL